MSCSGENCNSIYIQNKKYNLCSECVYKKNHGGKSKQEVQFEKSKSKLDLKKLEQDLDDALEKETPESLRNWLKEKRKNTPPLPKNRYSKPKQISSKQVEINKLYKATCIDMDYTTEPICTGCGKYQGGDIKLSHSHIISREDCKRIGKPELIYDKNNIHYHCMNFGNNSNSCHVRWENPTQRNTLMDYEENIKYIEEVAPEILYKYLQK